jgi:predicted RNA-binding Zn-ribbon protein involved in translation (DUF1610 family)
MFINSSRASLFWLCARKWCYTHLFHFRPESENEALAIGQAAHHGLAELSMGISPPEAAAAAGVYYLGIRTKHWGGKAALEEWDESASYVTKMILCYANRMEPLDDFKITSVEKTFSVRLGDSCWQCGTTHTDDPGQHQHCPTCGAEIHYWVGTTDVEAERFGEPVIMDHKTTSSTPDDAFLGHFGRSFQLIGYAYGAGKVAGKKIKSFGVNALQKAKTLGEPNAVFKTCPHCKNGKIKVTTCATCSATGKVEKLIPLEPFRRKWFSITEDDLFRFELYAQQTVRQIEEQKKQFALDPIQAFPMNDKVCKLGPCPFIRFCWDEPAREWHQPKQTDGLAQGQTDYVDAMSVAAEEVY